MADSLRTQCLIAGGGPAGAMLGLLLARRGVDVVVLEKHADFLRDFRGDTIHPSTMEILDELGLAEEFLALGPDRVPVLTAHTPTGSLTVADFRNLPSRFPFVAMIPQWDFLDFLTKEAARYPTFQLRMRTEATGLLVEDGVVRGVRATGPGGAVEIRATLTVAADGRSSALRAQAGLPLVGTSPPIDVLWFRLPRAEGDPEETAGHIGAGHFLVMIKRGDYWQMGYVIPKGGADQLRAAGIEELRRVLCEMVPPLSDRVHLLTDWDQVSLLSVQSNRLRRWYERGFLCIGDAAHAMSPVGGVGINYAIQDAVEAANLLAGPLLRGEVTTGDLARIQGRRAWQVRIMQYLQAQATRVVMVASGRSAGGPSRLLRRFGGLFNRLPGRARIAGHLVGLGVRRVHVAPAAPSERTFSPAER